jgi:hypothetical protein
MGFVRWILTVAISAAVALMALAAIVKYTQWGGYFATAPYTEHAAFYTRDGNVVRFTKTFVFWVPVANPDSVLFPAERYNDLQVWLTASFGGWTRWRVEGGSDRPDGNNSRSEGFFYQASLSGAKPDQGADALRGKLTEIFGENNWYVVEATNN